MKKLLFITTLILGSLSIPLTSHAALGDILYGSSNPSINYRLTIGANGNCLTSNGSIPGWSASCGSGSSFSTTSANYWLVSTSSPLQVGSILATSTTATSTFANGLNLTGGCFEINGACFTGGTGSQTPWTQNIDGAGYNLSGAGFVNTNQYSGFTQNGKLLAYASSTNQDTIFGLGAGGQNATTSATTGYNSLFGYQAGNSLTTANYNTAIGYQSLFKETSGNQTNNTAIGFRALYNNTTGINNLGIGYGSLYGNATGNDNIAFGNQTNGGISGGGNVFIGSQVTNASGFGGDYAIASSTIIGYKAGYSIGGLGKGNTSANTLIGYQTGTNLSTGSNNLFIGSNVGSTTSTGSNNIAIGYDIATPSITSSNTLNIGNLIFGTGINGEGTTLSTGNIGIATTSPYAPLSVVGTGGVVAESFTATSTTANNVFMGNVGIGTSTPTTTLDVNGAILTEEITPATSTSMTIHMAGANATSSLRIGVGTSNMTDNIVDYTAGAITNLTICEDSGVNQLMGSTTLTSPAGTTIHPPNGAAWGTSVVLPTTMINGWCDKFQITFDLGTSSPLGSGTPFFSVQQNSAY